MADTQLADRVKQTSTTTGTGTYDLDGSITGFQSFVSGVGTGNQTTYIATDGTDWEIGIGTVTDAATDTLSRDTILYSTNSNNAVNWTTGPTIAIGPATSTLKSVETNTAGSGSPNIITAGESGKVFTNEGVSAANYHTLPTAQTGLTYTFIVQDVDGLRVTANSGDTIRIGKNVTAAAGYVETTVIGSRITLIAINATEWVDVNYYGPWTNGTWVSHYETTWASTSISPSWTTNTTTTAYVRRDGSEAVMRVHFQLSGAPDATSLTFTLPETIDSTVHPGYTHLGSGIVRDSGTGVFFCGAYTTGGSTVTVAWDDNAGVAAAVTQASPITFTNGDELELEIRWAVSGW